MSEQRPTNQKEKLAEEKKQQPSFLKTYRDANFLSKITFFYSNPFINYINNSKNKINDEVLLDMEHDEGATDKLTKYF